MFHVASYLERSMVPGESIELRIRSVHHSNCDQGLGALMLRGQALTAKLIDDRPLFLSFIFLSLRCSKLSDIFEEIGMSRDSRKSSKQKSNAKNV